MTGTLAVSTLAERPESRDEMLLLTQESWPEFMLHTATLHWPLLLTELADWQLLFRDAAGRLMAVGQTLPLACRRAADGTLELPADFDALMDQGVAGRRRGEAPNVLAALAASVSREARKQGASETVLEAMKSLARKRGLGDLIAPVRPTWKSRYPLTPIERYARWKRADGSPFDPWMRVHWQLGAVQREVIPRSLAVRGTVAQWETWTGLSFPESGHYVVEGALSPVAVDWERDLGLYEEPNVWMTYHLEQGTPKDEW